jgi:PAS domain-containing protein
MSRHHDTPPDALRQAQARMENMLDSLSDGVCAIDHAWRIAYINSRALEMLAPLHRTRSDVLGQELWSAIPELRGGLLEQVFRRSMGGTETLVRNSSTRR